ncbi:hypothetical protein POM88_051161 [Heracleum sosnowskyi]|uniref:Uncharacterized protein n=1 Tax=Heracleum sosnowskyi TaxID=360622 RepID=A0AAD8GYW0_9APIA|nr:hypothetical protein POM88_051161 [Heracleum sosnowskyi]
MESDPGFSGQRYFDPIGDVTPTLSTRHADVEGIPLVEENNSHLGRMESSCTEGAQPVKDESSYLVSCAVQGDNRVRMKRTVSPLAAIDEIMESQSSTACLSSPPHYQEDILHRRQNLEEELFQLSAESYSTASTDSNTSYSDDDSSESQVYTPHVDALCIDRPSDIKRKQNGNYALDSDTRPISGIAEDREPTSSELLHDTVCHVQQEGNCRQNKDCKRISKRRVVSLTTRDSMDDAEVLSDRLPVALDASRDDVVDIAKRPVSFDSEIHTYENTGITSHSKDSGDVLSEMKYLGSDDFIVNHFNSNIADSLIQETCGRYVRCNSILGANGDCKESELVVLRSSEQKLYMLLISNEYDGSETTLNLIGCHKIEDVKMVLVGLGLQIVSLEQVQVDLFSRSSVGGSNTSIFQFSMVEDRYFLFALIGNVDPLDNLLHLAATAACITLYTCLFWLIPSLKFKTGVALSCRREKRKFVHNIDR